MTDAASLHCPNCGAAVGSDAPRCPYCQARLAKISCGNCFALMLDSSDFCPKCGSPRARAAGQGTSARCPACKKELQQVTVGATAVMECAACDGVWVDGDVFERIVADREAQAAVLHRFSPNRQPLSPRIRYRPCVRCGKMMNRVNFGRVSGTVVDVCRGHGTYLDAGELHQIVAFIHAGGLEKTRALQVEEMREQERRLRALEERAARDRGINSPHASLSGGEWAGGAVIELISLITGRSG